MRKAAKISTHGYPVKKGMRCLSLLIFFMLFHFCAIAQQVRPKWVDNLKENGYHNVVSNLVIDQQNNVYVTGQFEGTIDADPSAGVKNLTSAGDNAVFIGKYKQDGTLIWAESIGGKSSIQPNGLAVDKDGNVSITGNFTSDTLDVDPSPGVYNLYNPNVGAYNSFLIHLDTNGNFLWANSLDHAAGGPYQGAFNIHVATDSRNNVIITSGFNGALTIGDSTYNAPFNDPGGLIMKYDSSGNLLWYIALQDVLINSIFPGVGAYDIRVDSQDNIIVSGTFHNTVNFDPLGTPYNLTAAGTNTSAFLAEYAPSGALIWVNAIYSTPGYSLPASSICLDQQNNIYFSAYFVTQINFGSTTVTGTTDNYNECISKYSSAGLLQFAKAISSGQGYFPVATSSVTGPCILAADQNNNIYLTGAFRGTVNFNMNTGTAENLTAHGLQDFFVTKYDADGNYIHAFNCGPPLLNNNGPVTAGTTMAIDNNSNIDIGGQFGQTMNFDPTGCSSDTVTVVALDKYAGFFAQYGSITVANNTIDTPTVSTFCANGTPEAIAGNLPTGGNGTYTYQWLSSADSVTFADISGATAQNYTPPTLIATTYYERMVSSDTCTVPTVSNIVGLHILPILAATVVTLAATTSSTIIFTWTAVTGATGYQVSTNGGQSYKIVNALADTLTNLQPGQSITISVQAAGLISCQLSAPAKATGSIAASDVVFVANAFTPNGDGRDDILHVKGNNIQSLKFSIYDQWGELLFSTTSQQNGWDGTYKGTKEPVGVYVYSLQAVMNDGNNIKKKGTITLLK